jgi:hypothetical protein
MRSRLYMRWACWLPAFFIFFSLHAHSDEAECGKRPEDFDRLTETEHRRVEGNIGAFMRVFRGQADVTVDSTRFIEIVRDGLPPERAQLISLGLGLWYGCVYIMKDKNLTGEQRLELYTRLLRTLRGQSWRRIEGRGLGRALVEHHGSPDAARAAAEEAARQDLLTSLRSACERGQIENVQTAQPQRSGNRVVEISIRGQADCFERG